MQSVLKKWRSIFTLSVNLYTKPALYQVLMQRRAFVIGIEFSRP